MTTGLSGLVAFVKAYAQCYDSTFYREEYRNIGQGGRNPILLMFPLAMQATWAGFYMADVARVVTGPLRLIAQTFRIAFHPLISFPLSIVSSMVESGLYEGSVATTLQKQTRYYARGKEVPADIIGSVSLEVDGKMRHFMLGNDITYMIKNSVLEEVDGKTKRYYVHPLGDNEMCDPEKCREIDWKGKKTKVKLSFEIEDNYVQRSVQGETRYYKLGNEVTEPVCGTVAIMDPKTYVSKCYLMGKELQKETPDCIKIEAKEFTLHYDTGTEIDAPTDTSWSFSIDGTLRHFASAKYNPDGASLGLSGVLNKIPRLPLHIPTRLSRFSIRALHFINDNLSNIIRVALVSMSVALVYFGSIAMAAGAIIAVSYEYLNHDLGVIPAKVALFMEQWMPTISMVGLLIVGSFTTQITAAITLLLTVPSVNLWVHQQLSNQIRNVMISIKNALINWYTKKEPSKAERMKEESKELDAFPRLAECDAPLVQRNGMALSEIEAILDAEENTFEINPAHLTKDLRPPLNLPENRNFSELVRLWDTLEKKWLEPRVSERLCKKLIDDKRFIQFMQKRFPEAKLFHYERNWRFDDAENVKKAREAKENHTLAFREWIGILAKESGNTPEAYIAGWVRQQLQHYVGKLKRERPTEGEHRFLEVAIHNTAKVLPFLLDPKLNTIYLEDNLVKLAVEAGDYCALASWRASREALESFTSTLPMVDTKGNPLSAQAAFASDVYLTLQKARLRSIDAGYQMFVSGLQKKEEMRDVAEDIHTYTALTRAMKRGFYPLEANDMREFGLSELLIKETGGLVAQVGLMKQYKTQIPTMMTELSIDRSNAKKNHVLTYLRTWVQENQVLSSEDKKKLLDRLSPKEKQKRLDQLVAQLSSENKKKYLKLPPEDKEGFLDQVLSDEDKKKLLDGALAETDDNFRDTDNHAKWSRLLLTILGVLRQKQTAKT